MVVLNSHQENDALLLTISALNIALYLEEESYVIILEAGFCETKASCVKTLSIVLFWGFSTSTKC